MFKKLFSFTTMLVMFLTAAACSSAAGGEEVDTINNGGSTEVAEALPSDSTGSGTESGQIVQSQQGSSIVSIDNRYKFSVTYPSDFSFSTQPDEKLANLKPKPLASFIMLNPIAASSEVVELEPADLEIRVYDAQGTTALDSWLTSAGLAGDGYSQKAFNTAYVSGLEVCVSTMIVPGCSYFVRGSDWIYQLIPITLEGESILQSFRLVPSQQGSSIVYTDQTHKFSVTYPSDFSFSTQPDEKLANLKPKPLVSFIMLNPTAASSEVVELEPADLEIRVYDAQGTTALDSWLTSAGLAGDGYSQKAFNTAYVSGLEVCVSTMIVPGCGYFILGSDWIYQLIPITLEGESILQSFMLLP